jgi:NitT/TauT family transport system permease protein
VSAIGDLKGWATVIPLSFIGWEALSLWNPRFIPGPASVVIYLINMDPRELLGNVAITISNSTQGFLLGALLGVGLTCLSHFSDLLRSSVRVLNTVVQSISVLVWTIIFVMVFGVLSFIPSVLVTAMVVLPVVLSNLITSVETVDEKLLDLTFLLGPAGRTSSWM